MLLKNNLLRKDQTASHFTYELKKKNPKIYVFSKTLVCFMVWHARIGPQADVIFFHPLDTAMNTEVKTDVKPLKICN